MDRTLPALPTLPRLTWRSYIVAAAATLAIAFVIRDAIALASTVGLMRDAIGYWLAGEHIRSGQPLYYDVGQPFGSEVFLFAPWFAWAWALLTFLPRDFVFVCWWLAMLAATVWAVLPLWRSGFTGQLAACVIGYGLAWGALWANVMPLLCGVLIYSFGSRRFPIMVGLAASLKILPIAYMWPYLVDRRWREVGVAVAIMVVLWAPAIFYGIADYPTGFSPTYSLLRISGWLWVGVAVAAAAAAIAARHTPYRWMATTLAILAAYPRLHLHYMGLLAVGHGRTGRQE